MTDRRELEEIAGVQPTRLERRMARSQLRTNDAMEASDQLGLGIAGKLVVGILGLLGIVAALIPTLLYFAVLFIPLFFLYTCLSHF